MGIKWIPSIIFKELLYVCTWCTSWRAFLCEQDMLFDSFSFIMHSDLKGLWALVASFGHKHVLLHAYLQPNDLPSPAFTTYRWTCKFYWPQFDSHFILHGLLPVLTPLQVSFFVYISVSFLQHFKYLCPLPVVTKFPHKFCFPKIPQYTLFSPNIQYNLATIK